MKTMMIMTTMIDDVTMVSQMIMTMRTKNMMAMKLLQVQQAQVHLAPAVSFLV